VGLQTAKKLGKGKSMLGNAPTRWWLCVSPGHPSNVCIPALIIYILTGAFTLFPAMAPILQSSVLFLLKTRPLLSTEMSRKFIVTIGIAPQQTTTNNNVDKRN
jgi:hypothetical protein